MKYATNASAPAPRAGSAVAQVGKMAFDSRGQAIKVGAMNETRLLLNAYYELLYERITTNEAQCLGQIKALLAVEIEKRRFKQITAEKLAAYLEASLAFLTERIETYNPIGISYTFESATAEEAFRLEEQLDWYDSRAEYAELCRAARQKAQAGPISDEQIRRLAGELISECGAYPDKSIIAQYRAQPTANRLPDYVVSRAIEQIIRPEPTS